MILATTIVQRSLFARRHLTRRVWRQHASNRKLQTPDVLPLFRTASQNDLSNIVEIERASGSSTSLEQLQVQRFPPSLHSTQMIIRTKYALLPFSQHPTYRNMAQLINVTCHAIDTGRGLTIQEELDRECSLLMVAQVADATVAAYVLAWLVLDELQIFDVVVHPHYRRRGLARQLLLALLVDRY